MKLAVDQLYFFSENVECARCGSSILCRRKTSINFICSQCQTVYEIAKNGTDFQYKIEQIKDTPIKSDWQPLLTIGETIQLKNIDYQIIGAFVKTDSDGYSWNEYFLNDKKDDTFFLTEYKGHWTFLSELKQPDFSNTNKNEDSIIFKGEEFKLYSKYNYTITSAKGEFPVDIIEKHKPKVQEFIAPPYVLSCETEIQKDTWFYGEYVLPNDINAGLKTKIELPERSEIGNLEVFEDSFPLHEAIKTTFLLLTGILLFQLFFVWTQPEQKLIDQDFQIEIQKDSAIGTAEIPLNLKMPSPVIITKSFTIKETNSLDFEIETPVNNSWFEAEITLINENSGEENTFSLGTEYYHGVESGESWSEGSVRNDFMISSIKPGKYHLEIQPNNDPINPISSFHLKTTWSSRHFTDFFIVFLLLLAYPVYKYFKTQNDERARWSMSDYSPYDT